MNRVKVTKPYEPPSFLQTPTRQIAEWLLGHGMEPEAVERWIVRWGTTRKVARWAVSVESQRREGKAAALGTRTPQPSAAAEPGRHRPWGSELPLNPARYGPLRRSVAPPGPESAAPATDGPPHGPLSA